MVVTGSEIYLKLKKTKTNKMESEIESYLFVSCYLGYETM